MKDLVVSADDLRNDSGEGDGERDLYRFRGGGFHVR